MASDAPAASNDSAPSLSAESGPADAPLAPPSLNPAASAPSTPRDSTLGTPFYGPSKEVLGSSAALTGLGATDDGVNAKEAAAPAAARRPMYKRPLIWAIAFVALAVVVLVVVLPVYFVAYKGGKKNSTTGAGSTGPLGTPPNTPLGPTSGGNGSTVTTLNGTTFTYLNPFGGYWVYDASNPWNNSAKANSWTPALSENWTWGEDHINGVNIGGLFVLEPFITPVYYQQNPGAVDEWTLTTLLAQNGTLNSTLTNHYDTFITEQDIAEIAGAGLNWIRVPMPFWAINTWDNVGYNGTSVVEEPFLARVCWDYFLRLVGWARKYGLRVNLDLHTAPGSQNGYNHSGRMGQVNWMNGPMGLANAERLMDYIRILAEFISQPEYAPVIQIFGMVNEPLMATIGKDQLLTFYLHGYEMIRDITGIGAGHGAYISMHDGFTGAGAWAGTFEGADRLILDTHQYLAFDGNPNNEPVAVPANGNASLMGGQWPLMACNAWGPQNNASQTAFGVTITGEFSDAINDCGLWVNGVGLPAVSIANCTFWSDATQWNETTKEGIKNFALASMDALQDYFFWTWKIAPPLDADTPQAPLWSYQLGLQLGYMPADPREATGFCEQLGVAPVPFNGSYASWQTGGAGAGTIAPTSVSTFGVWPPTTMANVAAQSVLMLPQYTSTASLLTLPPPTQSASYATVSIGDGWYDAADTASMVTAIAGCAYPDAWGALGSPVPTASCGAVSYAAATAAAAVDAKLTAAPTR